MRAAERGAVVDKRQREDALDVAGHAGCFAEGDVGEQLGHLPTRATPSRWTGRLFRARGTGV